MITLYSKKIKCTKFSTRKGVAILIAMFTLSTLLAVALSISNVAIKRFSISNLARNSVYALYAADAGVECALFWDIRGPDIINLPIGNRTSQP